MNELVSVVVPCYKSEHTLDDTLKSVFEQNHSDWEVIIVNDCPLECSMPSP